MKLPRDISGRRLVKCLCRHWGFEFIHQRGSHIVLQSGSYRLTVPDHATLKVGTLSDIFTEVAAHKGIDRERIIETL